MLQADIMIYYLVQAIGIMAAQVCIRIVQIQHIGIESLYLTAKVILNGNFINQALVGLDWIATVLYFGLCKIYRMAQTLRLYILQLHHRHQR